MTLVSNIKVESLYRSGVKLNKDHRTAEIKVFANVDFTVEVENNGLEDKDLELIRHKVNRSEAENSNEYYLAIAVPREITHDFSSQIHLKHPLTNSKTTIPVSFEGRGGATG
mmetsp:Transcript_27407/g.20559  ORF Transcript_27407/g.20559 Transcript_27407/m.20559 type:complete len:112 (+) Transcript_27407:290-625(+)